ncbi:MAG TPA: hypothetical protein VFR06_06295, partial [Gallionellaceae bacterium]|nr:hypothetical protein [Gallionellaceae bacterium]
IRTGSKGVSHSAGKRWRRPPRKRCKVLETGAKSKPEGYIPRPEWYRYKQFGNGRLAATEYIDTINGEADEQQ